MKKIAFGLLCFMLGATLFAAGVDDSQFEEFVEGCRKSVPAGCQVRQSSENRIVFLDMPLQSNPKEFNAAAGKAAILQGIRGTEDAEFIKKAGIIVVYNYITPDLRIFSIVISKNDL